MQYEISCTDPESFFRGGSTILFLVNGEIQKPLKVGQHRPACKMPFKWCFPGVPMMAQHIECWLGSFVIFQGIRTSIAKNSYIFVFVQAGGGG